MDTVYHWTLYGYGLCSTVTCDRVKEDTVVSSYSRMLMVSSAHVLSASRPDFRDIITRHASGVPEGKRLQFQGRRRDEGRIENGTLFPIPCTTFRCIHYELPG